MDMVLQILGTIIAALTLTFGLFKFLIKPINESITNLWKVHSKQEEEDKVFRADIMKQLLAIASDNAEFRTKVNTQINEMKLDSRDKYVTNEALEKEFKAFKERIDEKINNLSEKVNNKET